MAQTLIFGLNHIVAPRRRLDDFLALASGLGIAAVEIRNDLPGVAIEDGTPAGEVRRLAEAHGADILTINALQRFNDWNDAREREAHALARYAAACGAKALVMCPVNDRDDRRSEPQQADDLHRALRALKPILGDHGIIGFVEPLGFEESSLRRKRVAADAIAAVDGAALFGLVHDTFHHFLAGETEVFPGLTGLVHISGVVDASLARASIRDEHRVLVGPDDLLGNVDQIRALMADGFRGPLSFEPFAPSVHALPDQAGALRASIAFIEASCERCY